MGINGNSKVRVVPPKNFAAKYAYNPQKLHLIIAKSMGEECYPKGFAPDHTEPLNANGKVVDVPSVNVNFNRWNGKMIQNTFGGKPIVDYEGKPMFAELAIMQMAIKGGWSSRWVEVYYLKEKEPYYLTEWADVPGFKQVSRPLDSPYHQKLMTTIESKNCLIVNSKTARKRSPYSGCWDVLAWNGEKTLFIESKRYKKDQIGENQEHWLSAGLSAGLTLDNFLVVQWRYSD